MKWSKQVLCSILSVLLIGLIIAISCRIKNPVDDIVIKVTFKATEFKIGGQIIDASSGVPINSPVTLTFDGKDKDKVVDLFGELKEEFEIEDGFFNFGMEEGVKPTESTPLELIVIAKSDGYITNSQTLLMKAIEDITFKLRLVKVQQTPPGVEATVDNSGKSDTLGAVTQDLVVETEPEENTGATATLSIPQGTVIRDASGTPLTGDLTTTVVYYSPEAEEALESFPGGFTVQLEADQNGNPADDVTFISGGFIAVEISDQNGRQAETFDTPIEVGIQIPQDLINPETGQPVQDGDELPIWSYDEDTGKWTFEYTTIAGSGGSGISKRAGCVVASFPVKHLSYWNIDWFWSDNCYKSGVINIIGNDWGLPLFYKLKRQDGTGYIKTVGPDGTDWLIFFWAPKDIPLILEAYYEGLLVGSIIIDDMCGFDSIDFTVDIPIQQKEFIDSKVIVVGRCPNRDDIEIRPDITINYRKLPSGLWDSVSMNKGIVFLEGLEVGATYEFYASQKYKGKNYSGSETFVVTKDDTLREFVVDIPEEECEKL